METELLNKIEELKKELAMVLSKLKETDLLHAELAKAALKLQGGIEVLEALRTPKKG